MSAISNARSEGMYFRQPHSKQLIIPACLTFDDQFAFRPTGSTTAAIITILHKVTHLLVNNAYVIVIAIDYSKAVVDN